MRYGEVMTLGHFARTARAVTLAAMVAATPMAAFADGTGTYYDRTFVLAAHQKCNLFRVLDFEAMPRPRRKVLAKL